MKKLIAIAGIAALVACGKSDASDVKLYYMPGCPYCHQAMDFFEKELKGVSVTQINVTEADGMQKFTKQLEDCKLTSRGVPVIVVKGECIQGFAPEIGVQIKQKLGK